MRRALLVLIPAGLACGPFFYQAPPPLAEYPDRVSAKRWTHLFLEHSPPDPAVPEAAALDAASRELATGLAAMDGETRLAEIDRLLEKNRAGNYSAARANLLHELRELAADSGLLDLAAPYLEWRLEHLSPLPPRPPAERPWHMDEQEFESRWQIHRFQTDRRRRTLEAGLAFAAPAMQPYWLVRRGAFLMETGDPQAAAEDFLAVARDFPGHPRGEVALLMLGRCALDQARRGGPEAADFHDEAEEYFLEYLESHPRGRFAADAEGWLGAIAFDRGQLGSAVRHQIARLERQPTREVTRTALRECGMIFERLLETRAAEAHDPWLDPDETFDPAAVARHPLVARLFVQHCIDPAAHFALPMWWDDDYSGGRATIDFLKRKILRPGEFIRQSLADLGRELLTARRVPDATTLTLVAWSATEHGEHEQALALLGRIAADAHSDESLLATATVLQRLDRHADAVATFERLAAEFPNSPLLEDQPFRLSYSLFHAGQAGRAIAGILPYAMPAHHFQNDGDEMEAGSPLRPSQQLVQWLDTLLQFAPLEELESALAAVTDDPRHRALLGDLLRMRALAVGRFDLAEAHLSADPEPSGGYWHSFGAFLHQARHMDRAAWDRHAAPLRGLSHQLDRAADDPSAAAALHLAIARHWMSRRGRLTLPAIALCDYAASEPEKQDILRRRNGLSLGFPRDLVERELDGRDEATHALHHALAAAESGDPAVAAPALELANECLFRRAGFSLYQKSRALETDASSLSRDIHRQLRERFPDSTEAKRAVFFTFGPTAGPWMPGDYNPANSASALLGALENRDTDSATGDAAAPDPATVVQRVNDLPAATPLAEVRGAIRAAQRELDRARAATDPRYQVEVVALIDRLDDLRAAASLPGIRPQDYHNYAAGRSNELPPAFDSLLDFRRRLEPVRDRDGNQAGPRDDSIAGWHGFLERWPDSPKAEAASFRLTRLTARKFRSSRRIGAFHFPEAPIPGGYKKVIVSRDDPANDPHEVLAAIARHEERFPEGRYRDDLDLLRAGAMIDLGRYSRALESLDSILANPAQRDLHMIAALEFADISQRLLDPRERLAVARALRGSRAHLNRLRRLVHGDTFLSRLQPLMPWLETRD